MTETLLPDCDEVFDRFFAPWYGPEDLRDRGYTATRPDVEGWTQPGTPAGVASRLTDEGRDEVMRQIEGMLQAAKADWRTYLTVTDSMSVDWINAFDAHWTAERVADLYGKSDPADFGNDILAIVCEFGAVLGHVMKQSEPQLEWIADWPYWESGLLDVPSGYRINVFHWAIKRFSKYGLEDDYGSKVAQCLEMTRRGWDS